jgi:putative transposase
MRTKADDALVKRIGDIHTASHGTYGAPRIHTELREAHGVRASRMRAARLMKHAGVVGVSRRKFVVTTQRGGSRPAPDLVDRAFTADAPDILWVADITYIPTRAGFLYLAIVLDVFSRRIVGCSMSTTLHADVVLAAMNMALAQRKADGVIHLSDQGSQYTSFAFGKRCRKAGVRPSMGSLATHTTTPWRRASSPRWNACAFDQRTFRTHTEARMATFSLIEGFFNPRRRHSALGYLSPMAFEKAFANGRAASSGPREPAGVLAAVKARPGSVGSGGGARATVGLDRRSARRPPQGADRDEGMAARQTEPRDALLTRAMERSMSAQG